MFVSASEELAQLHAALVHRRHGIVTSLLEETEHPDARGLFVFNALSVDVKALMIDAARAQQKTERASVAGSGAAFERASALWAAFGETIERYSAGIVFDDQLTYASQAELGPAATALEDFVLFSPQQYAQGCEFAAPDPALRRAWVPAFDLTEPQREAFLPAQLVFLGMRVKHKGEIVFQSSSTGLACARDAAQAALSGVCEVVERDAFAAMWQMRYAPPALVVDAATRARLQPAVRRVLEASHLEIRLWDLTTDVGLPVVLCLARSRTDGTMSVGASANLDVVRAVDKAVVEALHGYVWGSTQRQAGNTPPERAAVQDPGDHFAYFLEPSRQATLEFLFANPATVSTDAAHLHQLADAQALYARLAGLGYRPLVADATAGDIASLGFHVVRAVVPGLQPLLFGADRVSRDERRLRRIAAHWGLDRVPEPNPDPHPFP